MRDWILIADDLRDLASLGAPFRMMTTRDYVLQPRLLSGAHPKIINLARTYTYQTDGYYASLLAEARGHRVVPSVETMLDLADAKGVEPALPELEQILDRDLSKANGDAPLPEKLIVCFGEAQDERFKRFGRILFDWYRAPVIQVTLTTEKDRTRIKRVKLQPFTALKDDNLKFFIDALTNYTGRVWKSPKGRTIAKYSIAVLYDPDEKLAPSSVDTLKHWARLAEKDGVEIEPITKKDLSRLAEFDALFIRETTSITNHTYRFARRAWAEGMPVIDDPISMMRCTNKVYLWELLVGAGLPAPETIIIQERTPLGEVADKLGFPLVLKIPDGSFSRGVKKAKTMEELTAIAKELLEDSDLVIAHRLRLARRRARSQADLRLPVQDGARPLADRQPQGRRALHRGRLHPLRARRRPARHHRNSRQSRQPHRRRLLRRRPEVWPQRPRHHRNQRQPQPRTRHRR